MNKRPEPKLFDVLSAEQITPNMRRVTIGGPAMTTFPAGQDGGYVKLMLPGADEKPVVRTYTIRRQSADALDIDFALHGDHGSGGPAVSWAKTVTPGETIRVGGPGPAKPLAPGADWYLAAGDMTALPAIAVNLEALHEDAVGDAVIEIQSEADRQNLLHPEGIRLHWVINPEPGHHPQAFDEAVRAIEWRKGRVYAWCATEFETMRRVRAYLREERGLGPNQLYVSSYWKQGLGEDQHKVLKRADAEEKTLGPVSAAPI
ncbi:siderophore-interacting protein [Martelella limonii]|uniref:siderophore-interacting protein n=1 Tax=Martelella limonii TaxID=1647649 RepID=UPI00157FCAEF|nr:siderophore-interacting protein [Martelella limonii]